MDSDPEKPNFTRAWRDDLEIVEAKKLTENTARAVYRFPVRQEYLNPAGGLHGGAAATFHDIGTSVVLNLISRPGFWSTAGTTRTLNMTYLRPAMKGEILLLDCEVRKNREHQREKRVLTVMCRLCTLGRAYAC